MGREIEVKHKEWQLEYFKVKYNIPERYFVVRYEVLVHQDLVALLHQDVEEFLVQSYWWQQWYISSLPAIQVRIILLAIYRKFGHKLRLASRALDGVITQTLLKPWEQFLFPQILLAFWARFLNLKK